MTLSAKRCTIAALAATVTVASSAQAAEDGKQRAATVAKRAASARVARFGISYPPGAWRADCARRAGGGWRCAVGTGRRCFGPRDRHRNQRPAARGQGRHLVLRITTEDATTARRRGARHGSVPRETRSRGGLGSSPRRR